MPVTQNEASIYLASHHGVLGEGYREVESLDTLDPDEYELEEEVEYVTLDLGPEMDPKYLQTEGTYQLIGMDSALPHLKIGNTILQGEVTPLIGTEVILGLIRNEENPLRPSHPPLYTTSKRISFRPIQLQRIDQHLPNREDSEEDEQGEEDIRPIFLKQDARYGPNKPEKLPGRKRDRDRAARRTERLARGMDVDEDESGEGEGDEDGMEVDNAEQSIEPATLDDFTSYSTIPTATPGAGPSTSPVKSVNSPLKRHDPMSTPIGRPRTRPVIEITSLPELAHLDIAALPANIRIMVVPQVIHELDPTTSVNPIHLPSTPFEYTKGAIKKLINPPSSSSSSKNRKIHPRRFTHLAQGDEGASLPNSYSPAPGEVDTTSISTPSFTRDGNPTGGGGGVFESTGTQVVTFNRRVRDDVEFPQFVTAGEPSPRSRQRRQPERVGRQEVAQDLEGQTREGQGGVADVLPEMRLDMRDERDAEARDTLHE